MPNSAVLSCKNYLNKAGLTNRKISFHRTRPNCTTSCDTATKRSDERPFTCKLCDKTFNSNATKLHLHELRHGGAGTVRCPHCPRLFYDKYQLARHIGVHSDERPFACKLCDKTFKLRSNWHRHAKVHSGATPYECTMCGKRFRYSSSRNLHVKTVHYKMPHPPRKKKQNKTRNGAGYEECV